MHSYHMKVDEWSNEKILLLHEKKHLLNGVTKHESVLIEHESPF